MSRDVLPETPPDSVYRETTDSELYALIYEVLQGSDTDIIDDRRKGTRTPYDCLQLIATLDEGDSPDQSRFFHVECQDLSCTGFSYLSTDPPRTKRLVVALGKAPFRFFVAEIMHQARVDTGFDSRYLVGCRFVDRLV